MVVIEDKAVDSLAFHQPKQTLGISFGSSNGELSVGHFKMISSQVLGHHHMTLQCSCVLNL